MTLYQFNRMDEMEQAEAVGVVRILEKDKTKNITFYFIRLTVLSPPGGVSRIKVQDKFFECYIKDDSRPISIGM